MLLTSIALTMVSPSVSAADWRLVGTNTQTAIFIDRASLVRTGRTARQRIVAVTPNSPVRRMEVVEQLDCDAQTAVDVRVTYVLADGSRIERKPDAAANRPDAGSIGHATLDFACGSEVMRAALGEPVGAVSLEEVALRAIGG